ncbi:MAG: large conductance mechanosensitive channel [Chthoniobacter sp.]|jgi:large conductance mechanosensitive channel|nr:large conductance mechanosensitive channel [Chthoniobacter sp.]
MSIIEEFKVFVTKGNVVDLAVGVIIGAAFGKIVESMVKDVITPLIGLVGGQPDFSSIVIGAHPVVKDGVAVVAANGKPLLEGGIMIGNFLNAVIAFLILAAVVFFLLVKPMNRLMAAMRRPAAPAAPAPPPAELLLLTEIRDLLKLQRAPEVGASPGPKSV